MDSTVTVGLGGQAHQVVRARLGLYLRLEVVLGEQRKAAQKGDGGAIADCLFKYLSLCIPELDRGVFNNLPWFEIINACYA